MAIRLLICQLVFVLVLAQASSSILDDTSSGSGAIEDTPEIEDETPDENSGLDDINDSNLPEEEFDEMTSLDEIEFARRINGRKRSSRAYQTQNSTRG